MIQLSRRGAVVAGPDEGLEQLRLQYSRDHFVVIPKIFAQDLIEDVLERFQTAPFQSRVHEGVGTELCMEDLLIKAMLNCLVNDPRFYRFVQELTGCGHIGCFNGRVYRMAPGAGHYDSWHDDVRETRLVTMSVNLSPEPYAGGLLQLRETQSDHILAEIANTGLGDALLFQISPRLKHRVSPVEGSVPKTAFAGWFQTEPDFRAMFRDVAVAPDT